MRDLYRITVHMTAFFLVATLFATDVPPAIPSAEDMNQAFGLDLFQDKSLVVPGNTELSMILGEKFLKSEIAPNVSVFSAMPEKCSVLKIPVEQIRIYSIDKTIQALDFYFFYNRQDFASGGNRRSSTKIKREAEGIADRLERKLNSLIPSRSKVKRDLIWNWQQCLFRITVKPYEYVKLRIVPENGLSLTLPPPAVMSDLDRNLTLKQNGDVFISNIPPVLKPDLTIYSTGAAFERVFLYYRNMAHDLFEITDNLNLLGDKLVASDFDASFQKDLRKLYRYDLRLFQFQTMRREWIYSCIDAGLPIVWYAFYNEKFDKRMDENTKIREIMPWKDWKKNLRRQKKFLIEDDNKFKTYLIVGYNKDSRELALLEGGSSTVYWVRLEDVIQYTVPYKPLVCVVKD